MRRDITRHNILYFKGDPPRNNTLLRSDCHKVHRQTPSTHPHQSVGLKKANIYTKSLGAIPVLDQFELDGVFQRYLDADP